MGSYNVNSIAFRENAHLMAQLISDHLLKTDLNSFIRMYMYEFEIRIMNL